MKKAFGVLTVLVAFTVAAALLVPAAPAVAGGNGNDCPGDVNGDNVVNILDLLIVLGDWGCEGDDCDGDATGDGTVGIDDLLLVLANFGPCEGAELCETSADCDDGDPCTVNLCVHGTCVDVPHPNPNCG